MNNIIRLATFCLCLQTVLTPALAMDDQLHKIKGIDEKEAIKLEMLRTQETEKATRKRSTLPKEFYYGYLDRPHTFKESAELVGWIYAASWALYPLSQPKVFREQGSFKKYRHNFGQLVFDRDEPFWNWFVHPLSGSQLYLFYRANGYTRSDSMGMAAISSLLFEFTIEIYTEPASVQDLYQTPVLGSIFGVALENFSMYLLNSDNTFAKFFGHVLNPSTLFWFYEGKIQIVPQWNGKDKKGVSLIMDF